MKYRDILGFTKSKKKIIKEQPKSKKTVLDEIKQEFNEWNQQPPKEKRWSGAFSNDDNGLTEFEQQGGKDFIKEVGMSQEIKIYVSLIHLPSK